MPGVRLRRIELHTGSVFTIRPSFVMPYMTGYTDDVEKPLFLRRWGVPHWALAYVFGRDEQYWYRLELAHSLLTDIPSHAKMLPSEDSAMMGYLFPAPSSLQPHPFRGSG